MDGFFRILEKTSSELICTRLYVANKILRDKSLVNEHCDFTKNSLASTLQSLTGKYRVFTGKLVYREIPITCFGSVQGLKGQILMKYREIYAFSTGISIWYLH
jgi:hypothetical protein